MPFRLLASLFAGFAMTACSPELTHQSQPIPPPGANASVEEGPQEQRLDEVVIQIREALQDRSRPLEIATYRLPQGATWPAVAQHYGKLIAWPRDPRLADHLRGAQARAWRSDDRIFAIALIETPTPGAAREAPLLVVATAE